MKQRMLLSFSKNLILRFVNKSLVDLVNSSLPDLNTLLSINSLVIKIAVKSEVAIPIKSVLQNLLLDLFQIYITPKLLNLL